jgi:hypothetical protein
VAAMKKLKVVAVAVVLFAAFSVLTPSFAQQYGREYGRPQDGFVSGQYSGYSGQYSGQYDSRVDGRASHNEGLPPSAADKGNGSFDNPLYPGDCVEAQSLKPDARPGWQARVRCNDVTSLLRRSRNGNPIAPVWRLVPDGLATFSDDVDGIRSMTSFVDRPVYSSVTVL